MKRWLVAGVTAVVVFAAVVVLLVTSGSDDDGPASARAESGRTVAQLNVGLAGTISNLDLTTNNEGFPVAALGLEQLLQLGSDGKLEPWLATSVDHPDELTYVYRLRKGVKFWDGSELTSADVAHSWDYARRPKAVSAVHFASVKRIDTPDRYTVVVKLKHPDAGWQYVPAEFVAQVFQKAFHEEHGTTMGAPGTLMMGTGPFKFDRLDPTRGAELSANPDYWGGKPRIGRISVKFFANETSMALAFRSGDIDVAPGIGQPQTFAATSGAKVQTGPSCSIGLFSMNTQVAPWDDVHVRRAVAYALNRSDIIEAYNGGYAQPITTLIPPMQLELLGTSEDVDRLVASMPSYPPDLEKAKQEMALSGHPDGFDLTLLSLNGAGQDLSDANQVVAQQLRQIGINARIQQVNLAAYLKATGPPPDQRPSLLAWSGCISPDPGFYMFMLGKQNSETGYNTAGYGPPAVDGLIAEAAAEEDDAKRLALYGQILERVGTDVPYVPLFVNDAVIAISDAFSWPGYSQMYYNRSWGLDVKPAT
jgi:peptide/nickel transport system substrate-binding protein